MSAIGKDSVRRKLLRVVLTTTSVALLLTGASLAYYDLRTFRQNLVSDLTAIADILGLASEPALQFEDPPSAAEYLSLLEAKPAITGAAIYTARGQLFADYSSTESAMKLPELPEADGYRIDGDELVLFKRIVANGEILGTVYVSARYELRSRLIGDLAILTVIMLLSLSAAGLISNRLHRGITGPIAAVTGVAHAVLDKRDFTLRAPKTTDDEIGVLVDAFNNMLDELGHRNTVLERTQDELRNLNAELEERVAARTAQLEAANKELEGFSYSVSHDLRAPLRAIGGFADLLWTDHQGQLDSEAQRKLGIIRSEADRMGMLIDDLLAFSRLGRKSLQPSDLDMAGLANFVFERLKSEAGGEPIEFRLGRLPRAWGDRPLLEQVWVNLISNAIKFSSKKELPVVEIGAITEENELVYFVRDNGAGFDPRYQAKLFGVFQRLHDSSEFPGTGVGLALVQRIIARHGGRVWADGTPGEGATFYFTLPKEHADGGD